MSNLAVTVTTSKTKSGRSIQVAIIPTELVSDEGPERMHWRATEIAHRHACTHYRVVNSAGDLMASGKAGALPSQDQTARSHGDGSDWSHECESEREASRKMHAGKSFAKAAKAALTKADKAQLRKGG